MGLIRKEANEKKWLAVMCQLDNPAVNLRNIGNRRKRQKDKKVQKLKMIMRVIS